MVSLLATTGRRVRIGGGRRRGVGRRGGRRRRPAGPSRPRRRPGLGGTGLMRSPSRTKAAALVTTRSPARAPPRCRRSRRRGCPGTTDTRSTTPSRHPHHRGPPSAEPSAVTGTAELLLLGHQDLGGQEHPLDHAGPGRRRSRCGRCRAGSAGRWRAPPAAPSPAMGAAARRWRAASRPARGRAAARSSSLTSARSSMAPSRMMVNMGAPAAGGDGADLGVAGRHEARDRRPAPRCATAGAGRCRSARPPARPARGPRRCPARPRCTCARAASALAAACSAWARGIDPPRPARRCAAACRSASSALACACASDASAWAIGRLGRGARWPASCDSSQLDVSRSRAGPGPGPPRPGRPRRRGARRWAAPRPAAAPAPARRRRRGPRRSPGRAAAGSPTSETEMAGSVGAAVAGAAASSAAGSAASCAGGEGGAASASARRRRGGGGSSGSVLRRRGPAQRRRRRPARRCAGPARRARGPARGRCVRHRRALHEHEEEPGVGAEAAPRPRSGPTPARRGPAPGDAGRDAVVHPRQDQRRSRACGRRRP